jgi:hypothetical protein
MKINLYWILSLSAFLILSGCTKETSVENDARLLRVKFQMMANGDPLRIGEEYINPLGEDFRVSAFKIYLGNFRLENENNGVVASLKDAYFLLDLSKEKAMVTDLLLNEKPFSRLVFQVGIDSILNVSGAQTGALDPMNGMFWTWNTGYINAKLEGSSSFSRNDDKAFTYHIGGFKSGEATQRMVRLPIPGQQEWVLEKSGYTEMVVSIDIDKWFRSTHDLPISSVSNMMIPGPVSVKYADNYATMFNMETIIRR